MCYPLKIKTIIIIIIIINRSWEICDSNFHWRERKMNKKETDKWYVDVLFCYTIQFITIKLCNKIQNPNSSSCWEIFDRKKIKTNRQTLLQKKQKLYTPYILRTGGIIGFITQPSIYGVIVYFCYAMSHWTIDQAIFATIDWHYIMAWFPASLLKHTGANQHARLTGENPVSWLDSKNVYTFRKQITTLK